MRCAQPRIADHREPRVPQAIHHQTVLSPEERPCPRRLTSPRSPKTKSGACATGERRGRPGATPDRRGLQPALARKPPPKLDRTAAARLSGLASRRCRPDAEAAVPGTGGSGSRGLERARASAPDAPPNAWQPRCRQGRGIPPQAVSGRPAYHDYERLSSSRTRCASSNRRDRLSSVWLTYHLVYMSCLLTMSAYLGSLRAVDSHGGRQGRTGSLSRPQRRIMAIALRAFFDGTPLRWDGPL